MQCYDLIGMQYFYLNNLDKASYYHERMMAGRREPENSDMRNQRHRHYRHALTMRRREGYVYNCAKDVYLGDVARRYQPKDPARVPRFATATSSPTDLFRKEIALPAEPGPGASMRHFAAAASDLSLESLPSPHSHLDFGVSTYSKAAEKEEEKENEAFVL